MIRRWLALGIVGSMGAVSALGREDGVSVSVRVEVQMVSVSVPDARLLVSQLQEAGTAQRGFDRVQEMVAQDKAALLGWPMIWLRCIPSLNEGRGRALCETVQEFRYPTEYDPPLIPQTFGGPGPGKGWGPFVPTAFETRQTGAILDVEASVEDGGRTVVLRLNPQFSRFLEFKTYQVHPSPWGIVGTSVQPDFATAKMESQFRVAHDRPILVGVFVMQNPEPHVELFILRARAIPLPPEVKFAEPLPLP